MCHLMEGQNRGRGQLRMFLKWIADNFLTQVTKELMTGDAVMDIMLTKKRTGQGREGCGHP